MAERSDQRTREIDSGSSTSGAAPDVDPGPGMDRRREEATRRARAGSRLKAGLRSPFSGLFSVQLFLLVLVVTIVSMILASSILPLGGLAGFAGIALVGFGLGLARGGRHYLELLLAGAIASGLGSFLDYLVLSLVGAGIPLVALGVGAGAIAGVVGHYFGRDLRDGLTRQVG